MSARVQPMDEAVEAYGGPADLKGRIKWLLDEAGFTISVRVWVVCSFLATMIALYGPDAKVLMFDDRADAPFDVVLTACLVFFTVELAMHTYVHSDVVLGSWERTTGYIKTVFFWLDVFAIITIFPDLTYMRVDRGSLATFSVGRRVFRMVRLVRLVRFYRMELMRKKESRRKADLFELLEQGAIDEDEFDQMMHESRVSTTKVGYQLSEQTTKTVILGVLLLLTVIPILDGGLLKRNDVYMNTAELLHRQHRRAMDAGPSSQEDKLLQFCGYVGGAETRTSQGRRSDLSADVRAIYQEAPFGLLPKAHVQSVSVRSSGDLRYPQGCYASDQDFAHAPRGHLRYEFFSSAGLRAPAELVVASCYDDVARGAGERPTCRMNGEQPPAGLNATTVSFDTRDYSVVEAQLGIVFTAFVMVLMIVATIRFASDAEKLVLRPIQGLIAMVNRVASDPLATHVGHSASEDVGGAEYETRMIEIAIAKITGLLRVGLGVAGTDIISQNLSDDQSETLNPLIPGKRIYSIIGFCDIHHFDEVTEALEQDVMEFVNSIAAVVHEHCCRWRGQCNKNLGNSFLFVWRIGDSAEIKAVLESSDISQLRPGAMSSPKSPAARCGSPQVGSGAPGSGQGSQGGRPRDDDGEINLSRIPGLDTLADAALIGFLKTISGLARSSEVHKWNPRIARVVEGFEVRMGFGLHVGWAIEGAVGSLHKIDATYLSPHVNMTARLETASKQYGISVLFSGDFAKLLSTTTLARARRLDVVTVKGSLLPMSIYTVDTCWRRDFPEAASVAAADQDEAALAFKSGTSAFWESSPDLEWLLRGRSTEFYNTFNEGIKQYINGNWHRSRECLEACDRMCEGFEHGGDGPSRTILGYMGRRGFAAPADWPGYRALTSK